MDSKHKVAFTLAEVLITLGIIGVVASLTLPSLIDNHNKKVVETRLEKFYSSINQAIKMAELDYGAREDWWETISDYDEQKAWCEKYIIPYMNVTKTGKLPVNNYFTIYLADGSAFASNGGGWYFYPGDPEKCLSFCPDRIYNCSGICQFDFSYNTGTKYGFEPYMYDWDGTLEKLKYDTIEGCYTVDHYGHHFCTKLIQYNGWKFPKDYKRRVKY